MMAPVIPINIRVMRSSTENVAAAEPDELELKPEPELKSDDDPELEPPKQSIPWPTQKNCTVPHVCPNLQVHSSSL